MIRAFRSIAQSASLPSTDHLRCRGRARDHLPAAEQIEVVVRVEFADDGETYLLGLAIRWNRSHVCVTVNDGRLFSPCLWVRARDVRRRDAGTD